MRKVTTRTAQTWLRPSHGGLLEDAKRRAYEAHARKPATMRGQANAVYRARGADGRFLAQTTAAASRGAGNATRKERHPHAGAVTGTDG